jgi:hypothetical protein
MVTKDRGPHVKQSGRDAWLRDVSLFCKVLNIAATRAIVVTMDAACYPAFHKFRVAYDGEVEHLRQALRAHGVAWSCGTELVGQPTYDGWHFDATCLDTVVDAVCKWLKKSNAVQSLLDGRSERHPFASTFAYRAGRWSAKVLGVLAEFHE